MRSTIDVILRLLVLTTSPTGVWPFGETFSEQHNLFLPYDQDMLCNEGTRWSCFCSASSKMNQSSLCAFNFDHLQAVGVQFDGCSLQLNRTVRHDQSYEQFIKDYLAWWIREECSIANCFGVEQTRISNLNSSQIVFIQAECSFADVNITRLSFVVAADSNAEQPNWIPASTVASILNAPIAIVLIAWAYSCYIFTRSSRRCSFCQSKEKPVRSSAQRKSLFRTSSGSECSELTQIESETVQTDH
ncbi:Highly reducing polyketide synthase alnA [Trichinella spiralis]|uniref:Highly reducing polyketide synthase alnA n=1 Tax=Trichinella spiralis TaxID=6334 RepID=A0ABR3KYQ7_TRISP